MSNSLPTILKQIKNHNQGYLVNLRYRKPYILFLDYTIAGKRIRKSFNLKISGDNVSATKDKEAIRIALAAREELDKKVRTGEAGAFLL